MTTVAQRQPPNSVYPEFSDIWRFIDHGDEQGLMHHPNLHESVNAKQRGYTPLLLVPGTSCEM